MTVQSLGPRSAVVSLTPAELLCRGCSPLSLTREQALALLREAGVTLSGRVEIETYPGRREVLVFARTMPEAAWFAFDTLPELMGAALALRQVSAKTQLWWWQGRYWLGLPPDAARACRSAAVGEEADPGALEEGRLIFPHNAAWELLRQFLRLHI